LAVPISLNAVLPNDEHQIKKSTRFADEHFGGRVRIAATETKMRYWKNYSSKISDSYPVS